MKQLELALDRLGLEYTENMLAQFDAYMELVLAWNEKVNLTAIRERDDFIKKHFIDSVLCAGQPEVRAAESVIDVGTGAGFPGMPLAILFPQKRFVLMDSLNKRIKILEEIYKSLSMTNVCTVHGRAEELARDPQLREGFDLCVSRAVANLSTLSEYCIPFIKRGGYFLAYKGSDYEAELHSAKKAVAVLGGRISEVRKAELDDFDLSHHIIYIRKEGITPSKYPRKAGIPAKEPII